MELLLDIKSARKGKRTKCSAQQPHAIIKS